MDLSQFPDIYVFIDALHHKREDEQCEEGSSHQSADDDDCQRPLTLAADAMAQRCRHETEGGHHRRHQHTADARVHAARH